jgi:phenylacetate-coenzyme A ligase PaaK-like adenylate-forming protein
VATRTANLEVEMNIPEYEKEIEGLSEEELASKVKELQLERQVRTLEMVLTNSPLYRNCLRKDGLDFAIIGHD